MDPNIRIGRLEWKETDFGYEVKTPLREYQIKRVGLKYAVYEYCATCDSQSIYCQGNLSFNDCKKIAQESYDKLLESVCG